MNINQVLCHIFLGNLDLYDLDLYVYVVYTNIIYSFLLFVHLFQTCKTIFYVQLPVCDYDVMNVTLCRSLFNTKMKICEKTTVLQEFLNNTCKWQLFPYKIWYLQYIKYKNKSDNILSNRQYILMIPKLDFSDTLCYIICSKHIFTILI